MKKLMFWNKKKKLSKVEQRLNRILVEHERYLGLSRLQGADPIYCLENILEIYRDRLKEQRSSEGDR